MEKQTIESLLEDVEFNTLTQIYNMCRKTHSSPLAWVGSSHSIMPENIK